MPVAKNQLNLVLTAEQEQNIITAMDSIQTALSGLTPLTTAERRRLVKMGYKSESFAREAQAVLAEYPSAFPGELSAAAMEEDFVIRQVFVPIQIRLEELLRRVTDTNMIAGSDLMSTSMVVYRNLKSHAGAVGLGAAAERMKKRFERVATESGTAPTEPPTTNP